MSDPPNRRDFLSGRAGRAELEAVRERLANRLAAAAVPGRGPTLLLRTVAMACDFDVMLNPEGPPYQLEAASQGLDLVHTIEQSLSVYRDDATVSILNRDASRSPVSINAEVFELLQRAKRISEQTFGAFDPAAGAIVTLWQQCRQAGRVPTRAEVDMALTRSGSRFLDLDTNSSTVFLNRQVELNLGAIGKGFAVDRIGESLLQHGVEDWLVHGGRSSVLAKGGHSGHDGWPVGLQNPLLPDRPFATLLLKDSALGTSGTAVQWFRHEGKRYGHILDPRTGWPVESMLSVSVVAPDAALADALSTAFFVLGVENAMRCCDNFPNVGAIFFPPPSQGRNLNPIVHNIPAERLFLETN